MKQKYDALFAQVLGQLMILSQLLDEHVNGEALTYAHVGDLSYVSEELQIVIDFLRDHG